MQHLRKPSSTTFIYTTLRAVLPKISSRWSCGTTYWLHTFQHDFSTKHYANSCYELWILETGFEGSIKGSSTGQLLSYDLPRLKTPSIPKGVTTIVPQRDTMICLHVIDHLCHNIGITKQNSLSLILMLSTFGGLLCLDPGFSEAGSFAPRQVSVGAQSIIDGSPGLRL